MSHSSQDTSPPAYTAGNNTTRSPKNTHLDTTKRVDKASKAHNLNENSTELIPVDAEEACLLMDVLIQRLIRETKPKTSTSGWGWVFTLREIVST